jgi:hypothetical protein
VIENGTHFGEHILIHPVTIEGDTSHCTNRFPPLKLAACSNRAAEFFYIQFFQLYGG